MHYMVISKNSVEMEDVIKYCEEIIRFEGEITLHGLNKLHAKELWASLSKLRIYVSHIKDRELFYRYIMALISIEIDLLRQIGGF